MSKCFRCGGTGSEPDNSKIGKRMRKLREDAGIGLRSMSTKMGLSPSYLVNLEQGQRRWNAKLVETYNTLTS